MPTPGVARHDMALLFLSIPIMIVMVALAVVPLVVMSRAEQRTILAEVERAPTGADPALIDELVAEPTLRLTA